MKKPLFVISFLWRYKLLILFFLLMEAGRHWDALIYFVGPTYFLIEMTVGSLTAALLGRHLFARDTLDAYVQKDASGTSPFVRAWNALDDAAKVKLTLYVWIALFLGASVIAASIAK